MIKPDEQRMCDDGMADVQLLNTRNRRDLLDVMVMDAVTGVDYQSDSSRMFHRFFDAYQLICSCFIFSISPCPGMQLNDGRTDSLGRINLCHIRRDEQR